VVTTIWRFLDAKPGHDTQSLGLVRALQKNTPVSVFEILVERGSNAFWHWLSGRYPPGEKLPAPDLLLGAGHATHWPMLAARRRWGGRIIVCMKPSLPLACFDLCLIPEHDAPPHASNVLPTVGVINSIDPVRDYHADKGLIVLGGPSRHFRWDNQLMVEQIERLVTARPLQQWLIATSRRTPASLVKTLVDRSKPQCIPFTATDRNWFVERLAEAGEVWVSEDSVSTVYEALTCGASVGLLRVPRDTDNRVTAGVDGLVDKGWVSAPGVWQLAAGPGKPLNEAARCAEWLEHQWLTDR
jgi:mitochondrial fission protein ELM1